MILTVATSGYFDPLHIGHVQLLEAARALGDRLVVILNTDAQAIRKKGYVFMPYAEREAVLRALRCVDDVIASVDLGQQSQGLTLCLLKPDIFAKGGDRGAETLPADELDVCSRNGIRIIYGVGGGKVQSSSILVRKAREAVTSVPVSYNGF